MDLGLKNLEYPSQVNDTWNLKVIMLHWRKNTHFMQWGYFLAAKLQIGAAKRQSILCAVATFWDLENFAAMCDILLRISYHVFQRLILNTVVQSWQKAYLFQKRIWQPLYGLSSCSDIPTSTSHHIYKYPFFSLRKKYLLFHSHSPEKKNLTYPSCHCGQLQ